MKTSADAKYFSDCEIRNVTVLRVRNVFDDIDQDESLNY